MEWLLNLAPVTKDDIDINIFFVQISIHRYYVRLENHISPLSLEQTGFFFGVSLNQPLHNVSLKINATEGVLDVERC